jgi:hypothetical protein
VLWRAFDRINKSLSHLGVKPPTQGLHPLRGRRYLSRVVRGQRNTRRSPLIGTAFISCVGLAIVFSSSVGDPAILRSLQTANELAVTGSTTLRAVQAPPNHVNAANDSDLQSIIRAAVDDAARRTGRNVSALQVVSSEAVTWPDGSLGCPQPGVMYTMAPVPGYRVRIQAGDTVLSYHASQRGYLVYCPGERAMREKTSQFGLFRSGVAADFRRTAPQWQEPSCIGRRPKRCVAEQAGGATNAAKATALPSAEVGFQEILAWVV